MQSKTTYHNFINSAQAVIEFDTGTQSLILRGSWLWLTIKEKPLDLELAKIKYPRKLKIDGLKITSLDTIGVYFITRILTYLRQQNIEITSFNLNENNIKLFEQINQKLTEKEIVQNLSDQSGFLQRTTESVITSIIQISMLITFFGQLCINIIKFLKSPLSLKWSEVARTINNAGLKGVGVASLLAFLIGVTLTYEMSPQFITYGANVYIVNFLGISLLKEVTPLLTAIIIAGRTGSSITAEIGVMKVQEEIDAIQTMGISPIQRLVLPKVIGVMIAGPLITAIADFFSMLGGAIVANASLGVNYSLFLERLQSYVSINNYACGIVKSLAFSFVIALTGCFFGFNVKGNANSIGEETTKSVVAGIILVVCIDAIFAIVFKILGI